MTHRLPAGYDELPPTVTGFEFEFTPNPLPSEANSAQILAEGTEAAGYETMPLADRVHKDGYYLSNGGLITSEDADTQAVDWKGEPIPGNDVRLIEYSSAAANSIRWSVAAASAGTLVVPRIIEQGNVGALKPITTLYHRNGHAHLPRSNQSTGAHQNHLFWEDEQWTVRDEELFEDRFVSFLAAVQVITGEGMVGDTFYLSQQAPHIDVNTAHSFTRASDPKPAYRFRRAESYAQRGQSRLEVHALDQPLSHFAAFVGAGVTSAFVRCLRFGDRLLIADLPYFRWPLLAMKESNTITGLRTVHELSPPQAKYMSVLDMLGAHLDFILRCAKSLPLSDEELEAVQFAKIVRQDLKPVGYITDAEVLADRLGWAGRATSMLREIGPPLAREIEGPPAKYNFDAIAYDLQWGRIYHKGRPGPGIGQAYWNNQPTQGIVPAWMVEHCVVCPPPATRTEQFVQAFTSLQRQGHSPTGVWDKISYGDRVIELSDPTGRSLPKDKPKNLST